VAAGFQPAEHLGWLDDHVQVENLHPLSEGTAAGSLK
jgi:hypothetical protein